MYILGFHGHLGPTMVAAVLKNAILIIDNGVMLRETNPSEETI
jgi:hypothetical protein